MTFKEQLWLNEAGEQIPAPSSKQRQESQQGTDKFIMFLGAVPLHFVGDKVTPLQPEQRDRLGRLFKVTGTRSCSQSPRICCQHGAPWVAVADVGLVPARATSSTSFQKHSQGPGHGTGVRAASWLPPGKEGRKTRINTALKVTPIPHPRLHSLVKAFVEGRVSAGIQHPKGLTLIRSYPDLLHQALPANIDLHRESKKFLQCNSSSLTHHHSRGPVCQEVTPRCHQSLYRDQVGCSSHRAEPVRAGNVPATQISPLLNNGCKNDSLATLSYWFQSY